MPSKNNDSTYNPKDDEEEEQQALRDSINVLDLKKELLQKKLQVKKLENKLNRSYKKKKSIPKKKIIKKEKIEETIYNPVSNKRIKKTKRNVKSIETQVNRFNKKYDFDYLSSVFGGMSF